MEWICGNMFSLLLGSFRFKRRKEVVRKIKYWTRTIEDLLQIVGERLQFLHHYFHFSIFLKYAICNRQARELLCLDEDISIFIQIASAFKLMKTRYLGH